MSHGDPNWQLPGEPVTRRICSSASGAQLWVGCRVEDVFGQGRQHTGVIAAIPLPPSRYVQVEWADGSVGQHLPERLMRVGTGKDNERHAADWLAKRACTAMTDLSLEDGPTLPPGVPDPPAVEHDRHYVQVAFDEPTVQALNALLAERIAQCQRLDELAVLTPDGAASLQLARRARAQLLYAYAQWLEGPA